MNYLSHFLFLKIPFPAPRCLTKHMTAVVQVEVTRPVCVEVYGECKELGRFMLRNSGSTVAAGVVTKAIM